MPTSIASWKHASVPPRHAAIAHSETCSGTAVLAIPPATPESILPAKIGDREPPGSTAGRLITRHETTRSEAAPRMARRRP